MASASFWIYCWIKIVQLRRELADSDIRKVPPLASISFLLLTFFCNEQNGKKYTFSVPFCMAHLRFLIWTNASSYSNFHSLSAFRICEQFPLKSYLYIAWKFEISGTWIIWHQRTASMQQTYVTLFYTNVHAKAIQGKNWMRGSIS